MVSSKISKNAPPLTRPPKGSFLDRVARFMEGGGQGEPTKMVLDLTDVFDTETLARIPSEVRTLYEDPGAFQLEAGLDAKPYSRVLLALSAVIARQTEIPDRTRGFEGYPVGSLIYRDKRGRTHWDRYGLVDGTWRRIFTARVAGGKARFTETFVVYGLPIELPFHAHLDGETLVMTLIPKWSAPFSWIGKVEYRTARPAPGEVRTNGDFRIPIIGFRVHMEFRGKR